MSLFLWIVLVKVVYMTWISERAVDTSISVLNGKFMNIHSIIIVLKATKHFSKRIFLCIFLVSYKFV